VAAENIGKYAEQLIKHKARLLVGRAGLTASDVPDLVQNMTVDLLKRLSKYDPAKASRHTFIARLVNHHVATILEARMAQARDCRRCSSLNEPVAMSEGKTVERGDTLNRESDRRMQGPVHSHESRVDLARDMEEAIADLPPDLRELCERLMDKAPAEVSREMGISRGALYDRRKILRRHFAKKGLDKYLQKRPAPRGWLR